METILSNLFLIYPRRVEHNCVFPTLYAYSGRNSTGVPILKYAAKYCLSRGSNCFENFAICFEHYKCNTLLILTSSLEFVSSGPLLASMNGSLNRVHWYLPCWASFPPPILFPIFGIVAQLIQANVQLLQQKELWVAVLMKNVLKVFLVFFPKCQNIDFLIYLGRQDLWRNAWLKFAQISIQKQYNIIILYLVKIYF